MDLLKERVTLAIEQARDEISRVGATIHANPEVGLCEFKAAALLTQRLERYGLEVKRGVAGMETAFVAAARGQRDRPCVGLICEYDALAGLGHACGHNLIATVALGAAVGLQSVISEVPGSVAVLGTPAEENAGGKIRMIDEGVFADIDAVLSAHPGGTTAEVPIGPGLGLSVAASSWQFEFQGRTAHAAVDPQNGINALNAVIELFNGVNALRQHVSPDVRIHGIITHGGEAPNIVPKYAAARLQVRALDYDDMSEVAARVVRIAEGAAMMTGAELKVSSFMPTYKNMIPNRAIARVWKANLERLGVEIVGRQPGQGLASGDGGNVSHVVPTAGITFAHSRTPVAGHSKEWMEAAAEPFAYNAAVQVAKAMAVTALELLLRPELLDEARQEFDAEARRRPDRPEH